MKSGSHIKLATPTKIAQPLSNEPGILAVPWTMIWLPGYQREGAGKGEGEERGGRRGTWMAEG